MKWTLFLTDGLIYDHETGRGGLLQAGGHTSRCLHLEFQKCHVVPTGRYIIMRQPDPPCFDMWWSHRSRDGVDWLFAFVDEKCSHLFLLLENVLGFAAI